MRLVLPGPVRIEIARIYKPKTDNAPDVMIFKQGYREVNLSPSPSSGGRGVGVRVDSPF